MEAQQTVIYHSEMIEDAGTLQLSVVLTLLEASQALKGAEKMSSVDLTPAAAAAAASGCSVSCSSPSQEDKDWKEGPAGGAGSRY